VPEKKFFNVVYSPKKKRPKPIDINLQNAPKDGWFKSVSMSRFSLFLLLSIKLIQFCWLKTFLFLSLSPLSPYPAEFLELILFLLVESISISLLVSFSSMLSHYASLPLLSHFLIYSSYFYLLSFFSFSHFSF